MSFTGVIHKDDAGVLWFDDVPVRRPEDVPTGRAWKGTLWYAPSSVTSLDFARIMRPGDSAFGPEPGRILGVKLRVGRKGAIQVWNASTWGVRQIDTERCYWKLQKLRALAAAVGLKVCKSVAGTAMRLYLDRFDGKGDNPFCLQLPSRWRAMAHASLHGGPIVVARGGAPHAVQIDVSGAYLSALSQDVPVYGKIGGERVGGWTTHDDRRWSIVRKLPGFVDATVKVSANLDSTFIPPLPLHMPCGSVFGTGRFRGVWTIAQVVEAEERGEIEIERVHQFCYARETRPLFAELAETIASFPLDLGKKLYTRFWGKLGSRGGYCGVASEDPREGEVPAAGLWWRWEGIALDSHKAQQTYRPDLAAFVSSHNHRRVFRSLRQLRPGSVIACHVDAIWTDDLVGAAALCSEKSGIGGWRKKRSGNLRFYGYGAYQHGEHVAASGYDNQRNGKLTPEKLKTWADTGDVTRRRLVLYSRDWEGDPATSATASSRPLSLDLENARSPCEGPSVYDSCWTTGGWMRKPTETDGKVEEINPPHYVEAQPSAAAK